MEWQPIETAPWDGAYLIANAKGEVCPCQSRKGERIVSNMPGYNDWSFGELATSWAPFPSPPVQR